ncbi:MAG: ribonuclease T [Mesorhizobium sp.]
MTFLNRAAIAALAAIAFCFSALASDQRRPGDFDFYVLSLSWSPSYCLEEGDDANSQQCSTNRPYGFIVHGLWPQYERGYPRECYTSQRRVPDSIVDAMQDIMPSGSLVGHQWRMHGSCSGLSQRDYFRAVRKAYGSLSIPKQFQSVRQGDQVGAYDIERAFMSANPGLPEDGISVACGKNLLREVRICMTRDLKFRTCGELERKACRANSLQVPRPGEN